MNRTLAAVDATLTDPLVDTVLEGRYQITGQIAQGGMASVYEALDRRLDRAVAVKIMHPPYANDQTFVDRFIREAKSAARLGHPNIVAVYDQGRENTITYLVMEKVDGHTLREVLSDHGRLTPAEAIGVVEPVLQALAVAHDAGFVHRDVKPENVLISTTGMVKVADFGLARAFAAAKSSTTRGVVMGTVAYVSPEQIMQGEADPRSDVYAAGILLYEMLTGEAPFTGDSAVNIAFQHVHHDMPAANEKVKNLPAPLNDLILRATRRDRDARPSDAGTFLMELRTIREELGLTPKVVSAKAAPRPQQDQVFLPTQQVGGSSGEIAPPASPPPAGSPASRTSLLPPEGAHPNTPALDDKTAVHRPPGSGATMPHEALATTRIRLNPGDDGDDSHSAGRKKLLYLGIAVATVLALIAGIWGWTAGAGPSYVSTPKLVGLTKARAEQKARAAGLLVRYQKSESSDTAPAQTVLKQDPDVDSKVEKRGTITLVLSAGPKKVEIPGVAGLSEDQAASLLASNNLSNTTVSKEDSDSVPEDSAIRTDPPAGHSIAHTAKVTLVISNGPPVVAVPSVIGQPQAVAEQTLKSLGLEVGITQQPSPSAPGTVLAQDQPAGATLHKGDKVTITVAQAIPTVEVPNVVGKSYDDAKRLLESQHFKVGRSGRKHGDTVFFQTPVAGSQAKAGDTVTLYLR